MITIQDLLRQKGSTVYSISPEKTVYEAIGILVEHNVGALLVIDGRKKVVGIITERDILREALKRCEELRETPIKDVMTSDLIIGVPEDDIEYVKSIMTQNRIRHLPVMSGKKLVGIISIGDVVRALMTKAEYENRMLKDYISGVRPG